MHEPDELPERESRTKRKKQMLALQDIGKTLVELPPAQLARIPLDTTLADAIHVARSLKSHEAKRRQLQYIGRLMRHIDAQPIAEALDKIQMKDQRGKAQFHQIEQWRDRLIAEGDAVLQDFLIQFPNADSQYLRQLIRKSQKNLHKNTVSTTELFRYLRGLIESQSL